MIFTFYALLLLLNCNVTTAMNNGLQPAITPKTLPEAMDHSVQSLQEIAVVQTPQEAYASLALFSLATAQAKQANVALQQPAVRLLKKRKFPESASYICAFHCGEEFDSPVEGHNHEWIYHLHHKPSSMSSQRTCLECNQPYKHVGSLKRHILKKHAPKNHLYVCLKCQTTFRTKSDFKNHQATACTQ